MFLASEGKRELNGIMWRQGGQNAGNGDTRCNEGDKKDNRKNIVRCLGGREEENNGGEGVSGWSVGGSGGSGGRWATRWRRMQEEATKKYCFFPKKRICGDT